MALLPGNTGAGEDQAVPSRVPMEALGLYEDH